MSKGLEALKHLKENKRKHWLENDSSNECLDTIEKALKALEIIKDYAWVENGEIHIGLYGEFELVCKEDDFESKEKYDLLKEELK